MDINQIRSQLRINRHRLDEELELQAYVAEQISAEVAKLKSRADAANEGVKDVEARLVLDMRDEGNKQTVAETQARIQRDKTRKEAEGTHAALRYELQLWEGLKEAWKQRSFALRNLAGLYSSDYFAQATQSVRGPQTTTGQRHDLRDHPALSEYRKSDALDEQVKPRVRRRVDE